MKSILFFILMFTGISLFSQKQLGTDTIYMNVTVAQAKTMVDTNGLNTDFVVLDVRQPSEYVNGHIVNAININYYDANFGAQLDALDHNKMYLMHCAAGSRSGPTFTMMQSKHFREVYHMSQGFYAWLGAGYPFVTGYTAVNNMTYTDKTTLFMNPNSRLLIVNYTSDKPGKIIITDLQGKQVLFSFVNKGRNQFELSGLPRGIYIVNIEAQGVKFTKKIFVE